MNPLVSTDLVLSKCKKEVLMMMVLEGDEEV